MIPTLRQHFLADTLHALARQTVDDFEVIVTENGEQIEQTAQLVDRFSGKLRLRYLFVPESGLNRARNAGSSKAVGKIIALLDDDAVPGHRWAEETIHAHRSYPLAGTIGGPVSLRFLEAPPSWLVGPFRAYLSELDLGREGLVLDQTQHLVGMNMSYRRAVYDQIGGFGETTGMIGRDPPQLGNDEIEFIDRARPVGPTVYWPGMAVAHQIPGPRTRIAYFRHRFFGQGYSDTDALLKSKPPPAWWNLAGKLDMSPDFDRWRDSIMRFGAEVGAEGELFFEHSLSCRIAYFAGIRHRILGLDRTDVLQHPTSLVACLARSSMARCSKNAVSDLCESIGKPRVRWKRSNQFSVRCLCQRISFYAQRLDSITGAQMSSMFERSGPANSSPQQQVLERLMYAGGPAYRDTAAHLLHWARCNVTSIRCESADTRTGSVSAVVTFTGSYSVDYVLFTIWATGFISVPCRQLSRREALQDGNEIREFIAVVDGYAAVSGSLDDSVTIKLSSVDENLASCIAALARLGGAIETWYEEHKPALKRLPAIDPGRSRTVQNIEGSSKT